MKMYSVDSTKSGENKKRSSSKILPSGGDGTQGLCHSTYILVSEVHFCLKLVSWMVAASLPNFTKNLRHQFQAEMSEAKVS